MRGRTLVVGFFVAAIVLLFCCESEGIPKKRRAGNFHAQKSAKARRNKIIKCCGLESCLNVPRKQKSNGNNGSLPIDKKQVSPQKPGGANVANTATKGPAAGTEKGGAAEKAETGEPAPAGSSDKETSGDSKPAGPKDADPTPKASNEETTAKVEKETAAAAAEKDAPASPAVPSDYTTTESDEELKRRKELKAYTINAADSCTTFVLCNTPATPEEIEKTKSLNLPILEDKCGGKSYLIGEKAIGMKQMVSFCCKLGMNLVSIETLAELNCLAELIGPSTTFFTSGIIHSTFKPLWCGSNQSLDTSAFKWTSEGGTEDAKKGKGILIMGVVGATVAETYLDVNGYGSIMRGICEN